MMDAEDDSSALDGNAVSHHGQLRSAYFRFDWSGFNASSKTYTIGCVFALAFLSNFSGYCSEIPLLRLVERSICERHYGDGSLSQSPLADVEEKRCKIPAVQDTLAFFMGYKMALDAVPPLLTSLWFGRLADRIGRRRVAALACTGELLNLLWVLYVCFGTAFRNVELAWIAACFLFIGGGQFLLFAMFYVIVSDVAEASGRGKYLSILHAIRQLMSLIAVPIGAELTKIGLKVPFTTIVVIQISRYAVIYVMAETSPSLFSKESERRRAHDRLDTSSAQDDFEPLLEESETALARHRDSVWSSVRNLVRKEGIVFCFLCFLVKRIAFTSESLMYQYVSESLQLPLNRTAWVRIPLGISATLVTSVILPITIGYFERKKTSSVTVNANIIRTSLAVLVLGFLQFFISRKLILVITALVLCGAGEGLEPSLQALASSVVDRNLHSHLFAVLSLIDTSAKLLGGPIMAAAYAFRDSDGNTYGLCFLLSSILFGILFFGTLTKSFRTMGNLAAGRG